MIDLGDPAWFLESLDADSGAARFVRAERSALSAQPFLDEKWLKHDLSRMVRRAADLPPAPASPRLDFIWHSSFCASTAIAAALDAPGLGLSLKEPSVLMDLADLKRRQGGRLADPGLARAVFSLLARRFEPGEQVLIKASNAANSLIGEAAACTDGRALLLWGDCESFLVSILRSGQEGSAYVRELFMTLAADGHPAGRWPPTEIFKLTDLQMAALVWRMQMDVLEAAAQRLGDRSRSLDFRRFLAAPGPALAALDDWFGIGIGLEGVERVLAGPLLRRDAKSPTLPFDAGARAEEGRRLRQTMGADIAAVLRWSRRLAPREPRLGRPLELGVALEQGASARPAGADALQSSP
jgi:hypothetical protein